MKMTPKERHMLIAALSRTRKPNDFFITPRVIEDVKPYLDQMKSLEVKEREQWDGNPVEFPTLYLRFEGTEEEGYPLAETHTCIGRDVVVFAYRGKVSAMEVF